MREHPMLFSAPMVRALLREENPKTVTRRLLNPQPILGRLGPKGGPFTEEHWIYDHSRFPSAWKPGEEPYFTHIPYAPGDRVWIREAWRPLDRSTNDGWTAIEYRADLAVGKRYWRDLPVAEARWFWVRVENGHFPALWDEVRKIWHNSDTWYELPGEVLESELISPPSWAAPSPRSWHYVTEPKRPEPGQPVRVWVVGFARSLSGEYLGPNEGRRDRAAWWANGCHFTDGTNEGQVYAWEREPEQPPVPEAAT
jgi:hypothetical protein